MTHAYLCVTTECAEVLRTSNELLRALPASSMLSVPEVRHMRPCGGLHDRHEEIY